MERISRFRAILFLALFAFVLTLYAGKLFVLQIVETDGKTEKIADDFNSSIQFDSRMYRQDITGSMVHAAMLARQNIITQADADALIAKYGDWYTEEGTETGFIGTLEMLLKDAPTVVEAEGE